MTLQNSMRTFLMLLCCAVASVPLRAALYLRVSTARQAEHDVSIPDQRKQGETYCASRGY